MTARSCERLRFFVGIYPTIRERGNVPDQSIGEARAELGGGTEPPREGSSPGPQPVQVSGPAGDVVSRPQPGPTRRRWVLGRAVGRCPGGPCLRRYPSAGRAAWQPRGHGAQTNPPADLPEKTDLRQASGPLGRAASLSLVRVKTPACSGATILRLHGLVGQAAHFVHVQALDADQPRRTGAPWRV